MGMMQEFQKADEKRRHEVKELQGEVATMLKDFGKGDTERASEVGNMRSGVATMMKDFAKGDTERASEVGNIRSGVATMMKDFAKGDAERASEVGNIRSGVATMMKDFAKGDAERASEVARIHSEVGNIRSEVATMLKDLAKGDIERAKGHTERARGRAHLYTEVWGRASAKKVTTAPAVELPKESPPEEQAVEGASLSELRDKVFTYLANHPGGTRLVELEGEFGVARIQIAKVIRGLIEDRKVEKRDLLYFAI